MNRCLRVPNKRFQRTAPPLNLTVRHAMQHCGSTSKGRLRKKARRSRVIG